ncbi:alkyl hydroperoxide reductase [Flavobacterium aquidurense]|jgi:peroxiredoxin|uniref:peroxiredoxin-like family protein n=1 Tax=Flavobacterium aquidurense TaxID=362413 RepID=UPI00091DEAB0|nr:peroxiredoxin-like family protein [Flavobacterium aquidurense]OXA70851.1 alkyl hydroperoxide reductase [Flavobacterium aquidurense]SHF97766.1 Peroxiredoxin [Flavobacterium frigidimaris]
MNTLAKQIESLNKELTQQVPVTVLEIFERSVADLKTQNIEYKIAQIGDKLIPFSLPNAANQLINSKDILRKGKMILAFFRGSWCPYCNLELRALQENLTKITHKNVTLLAVSPQSTDQSMQLIEKHLLTFDVLTDTNNMLAKQLGLSFELQDFALPTYHAMGIHLEEFNQNHDNTLPVPAVFVVDCDGSILYKFADADYRNRLDIDELLQSL